MSDAKRRPSLAALVWTSLTLGLFGFGGGWVVLAWMRRVFVLERGWATEDEFAEVVSVASALPGVTGTNVLTVVGYKLGGARWATLAVVAFIAPGFAIVTALAALYDRMRELAFVASLLGGMGAAVAGVVLSVAIAMRAKATESVASLSIAAAAFALLVSGAVSLLGVVALAAAFGIARELRANGRKIRPNDDPQDDAPPPSDGLVPIVPAVAASVSAWGVLLLFARIGVATFGGGYAMVPEMHHATVGRGLLDETTFTDAIALGQITPGPVALSGTFLGYRMAGVGGALAATVGMLVPPLLLALLAARSLARFRSSPWVRGALAGVAPAVVGVIAAAAWSLGRSAVRDGPSIAIAVVACLVAVARPKANPILLLFAGALAKLLWQRFAR